MKKVGIVKYRESVNAEEENERFLVIEERGDRILVGSLFTTLVFGATTVLRTDALAVAVPCDDGREAGLQAFRKPLPSLTDSPYPTGTRDREEWDRGCREAPGGFGGNRFGK